MTRPHFGRLALRRLVVGEVVALAPSGPDYRVARVNACGALLKPRYSQPREVTIGERTFTAHEGGSAITVSAHAFVYRTE